MDDPSTIKFKPNNNDEHRHTLRRLCVLEPTSADMSSSLVRLQKIVKPLMMAKRCVSAAGRG